MPIDDYLEKLTINESDKISKFDDKEHLKSEILSQAKDVVEKIKEYVRMQKDLWQQVPYYALMAEHYVDNKSDVNQKVCQNAYKEKKWTFISDQSRLIVDLETGKLVHPHMYSNLDSLAIPWAFSLDILNAQSVINYLKSIKRRVNSNNVFVYIRHDETIKKYNIRIPDKDT